jgi:hypothetical protein
MTNTIYILSRRRVAFVMNGDKISCVVTAKKAAQIRERCPDALNVRELLPAERDERTRFDPTNAVLYFSALSMLDLALWMVASGRLRPRKSYVGWRGKMIQFEEWFGQTQSGTGDTVPAMVREGVAIAIGSTDLVGEDEYLKNLTFDGDPDAWTALVRLVADGTLAPIAEIEIG